MSEVRDGGSKGLPSSDGELGSVIEGIGARLKQIRERCAGTSQLDMATWLGVSKNTLRSWEAGERNPDVAAVARLAQHYGVRLEWLLYSSGVMMLQDDLKSAPSSVSVTPQVEVAAAQFLATDMPSAGKGARGYSNEQLTELAMIAVGQRFEKLGLPRQPVKEALLVQLLVRSFELHGYSPESTNNILLLVR